MPHGGELRGPDHVRVCLDELRADRLGHGVRAAEDPALLDRIVRPGVALEVCPVSNVALGVYSDLTSVPLPQLLAAGATVALGADDPLLFGSRLAGQYATMRAAHEPRRRAAGPSWPGCRSAASRRARRDVVEAAAPADIARLAGPIVLERAADEHRLVDEA